MIFFIVTTVLVVIFALLLFTLFCKSYRFYLEKKWKKAWQYFVPTILAIAILVLSVVSIGPRLFDSIDLAGGHAEIITAEFSQVRFPMTAVFANGQEYVFSPLEENLEAGKSYLIRVTPRTKYIVSAEPLER